MESQFVQEKTVNRARTGYTPLQAVPGRDTYGAYRETINPGIQVLTEWAGKYPIGVGTRVKIYQYYSMDNYYFIIF